MKLSLGKAGIWARKGVPPEIVNRDYVLERKRALEKKIISCMSDVKVAYTLKEQKHIYSMST